jgi:hypothetical protein
MGPRLARLKSYSGFVSLTFIGFPLVLCRFPGRDDANVVIPKHERYDQETPQEIPAYSNEPFFAIVVRIFPPQSKFVLKNADHIGELNAVLFQIAGSLAWIPLVGHGWIVCTNDIRVKALSRKPKTPGEGVF